MKFKDLEVGKEYGYITNPGGWRHARKATVLKIGVYGEVQGPWEVGQIRKSRFC